MRRALTASLAIAVLVLVGRPSISADEPTRLPLTEKDMPAPRVDWYGLYMNGEAGAKVGWVRVELGRAGEGADAVWFGDVVGRIELNSMGKHVEMDLAERQEFDATAPFALRGARSSMKQGENEQRVEISRVDGTLTAKVSAGGATRTLPVPAGEFTLADALTSERWIAAGRAVGDRIALRSFSMSELQFGVDTFTVTSRKESLVNGVKATFFECTHVTGVKSRETTERFDAKGHMISVVMGGMFEGRLEPEETAKQIGKSADLFVFGIAKIDKPIGAAVDCKRLVVEVDGEGASRIGAAPRQEVRKDESSGVVTLSLGASNAKSDAADAKEIEAALAETVSYPTKLPQVEKLAAEAVGDAKTPREKVDRLVHFVGKYVEDAVRPEAVSVPDIITSKRGDCTEHALLFVALARAAGIPAREVSGLMYMGDDVRAFGGHAWDEVALDGHWVPVDPTWDETETDATHITLERDRKGSGSLSTLGRLRFRLKEVEPAK